MKKTVITCPCCGAEYLAQEIYIPSSFFGKASRIEKDECTHQIIDVYGSDLDLEEKYTCDFCNTPFTITAKISFNTKEDVKRNFQEDYVTRISKERFVFEED